MPAFFGIALLGGFCGIPVCAVSLLFKKIRGKSMKNTWFALGICSVLFIAGFIATYFVYS